MLCTLTEIALHGNQPLSLLCNAHMLLLAQTTLQPQTLYEVYNLIHNLSEKAIVWITLTTTHTVGRFLVLAGHILAILYRMWLGCNHCNTIALFPGPAQVSGTCSGECLEATLPCPGFRHLQWGVPGGYTALPELWNSAQCLG